MKFDPSIEDSSPQASSAPWPPGVYDFEVREAEEATSAAGNEMIKITAWVYNQSGGRRLVFDYLVSTAAWKIKQFAASCGLSAQFEAGALEAEDLVGRTGQCTLFIDKREGYEPQNKVKGYLPAASNAKPAAPSPRAKAPADDLNDAIPF